MYTYIICICLQEPMFILVDLEQLDAVMALYPNKI